MTQELVVWTLLAGFLGLVWVMAFAVIHDGHATHVATPDADASDAAGSEPRAHSTSQRGAVFAA